MALVEGYFVDRQEDPFASVEWEFRDAIIKNANGDVVFRQDNVEVPRDWSQLALNIVASKYFAGKIGTPERERSVRQLIHRVASEITAKGIEYGYFPALKTDDGMDEAEVFYKELVYLLVNQMASFNSPVWFNIGVPNRRQQASACFILNVEDSMEGILTWIYEEGMIFKGGSGAGVNLSNLRGSHESLSTGGQASGPVSFMRGADASAGAIKSGGTTRRAAKMVILDSDHPDVMEFIWAKANEEKKAWALGEMGYDMGLNGEAWTSIQFQNANNSIRVTDNFMKKATHTYPDAEYLREDQAKRGKDTPLVNRTDGEVADTINAYDMLMAISEATHICGDPGLQFDDTCNNWHTLPANGKQRGSNPCSEYLSVDNSACNLASINLIKFVDLEDYGSFFESENFQQAVRVLITAQDILVELSEYPTKNITRNAKAQRQLGLGYANLGALLMSSGIPYDSPKGREYAAAITSLMTGTAYNQSAKIAMEMGSFDDFEANAEAFTDVIGMHMNHNRLLSPSLLGDNDDLINMAHEEWSEAHTLAQEGWARNAQATVLAPTGTIGFMMDCTTTGIEPAIALVSYKTMVGGGFQKLVTSSVAAGLHALELDEDDVEEILQYIQDNGTIEGADDYIGYEFSEDELAVFDCAFTPENGIRSISPDGHIKMMGVVQPFLSGAISKTVNLPEEATPEDIFNAYVLAWKVGVKAIAIYRDGSKRTQPLTTKKEALSEKRIEVAKELIEEVEKPETEVYTPTYEPVRKRLPKTRVGITHHFEIAGHDGYITVGLYDDGTPGEVFVTMAKQGSTLRGLMDAFGVALSIGLQYGVPIETYINKLAHAKFEPQGFTGHPEIPIAKSIVDYVARFLASKFMDREDAIAIGVHVQDLENGVEEVEVAPTKLLVQSEYLEAAKAILESDLPTEAEYDESPPKKPKTAKQTSDDAPPCHACGSITTRTGTCYTCMSCGTSSGCS